MRKNDKIKQKACYSMMRKAIRIGILVRSPICEKCETNGRIEAHHDNYDLPLDVLWLCPKCHRGQHRDLGWGDSSGVLRKGEKRPWIAGSPAIKGIRKVTLNLTAEIVAYLKKEYGSISAGLRECVEKDMLQSGEKSHAVEKR